MRRRQLLVPSSGFVPEERKEGVQSMSADNKQAQKQTKTPEKIEEHGIVTDVVVPIVQTGVGGAVAGAANAIVSNAINKPKDEKDK
jgi:hypothetical protein